MKKYSLLLISFLLISACKKDDDTNINTTIDLNAFPLTLKLEGYVNPDIKTYTPQGALVSSDIDFNVDGFFDNKTYFFDEIIFDSENQAALILSYLPQTSNAALSQCQVSYTTDSLKFFAPANGLDLINDYTITMAAKDRSELKLMCYQTKLKKQIADTSVVSTASFIDYENVLPLINDLQQGDTLSVQNYQLVYRP